MSTLEPALQDHELRVLSLNCWGLKYVGTDRIERIRAIADELARSQYEIVALQELWVNADFELVRSKVSARLPYCRKFYSGILGAGLSIYSKFPLVSTNIYPYSISGVPLNLPIDGEWIAGKALASAVILHPVLGKIEVFNTHMNARAADLGTPSHLAHHLLACWEFVKRVNESAARGRHVLALGDFNMIPGMTAHDLIRAMTRLTDAWESTHPPFQSENVGSDLGATWNSPLNSYYIKGFGGQGLGRRLDYILFQGPERSGTRHTVGSDPEPRYELCCRATSLVLTQKAPGHNFSFSDHFGLEAVFDIVTTGRSNSDAKRNSVGPAAVHGQLSDSRIPSESTTLGRPNASASAFMAVGPTHEQVLQDTLSIITRAYDASYRMSFWCITLSSTVFAGWPILAGLSALQSKPWGNVLFALFAGLFGWIGSTVFYAAYLGGKWERRALMGAKEELELVHNAGVGDKVL